MSAVGFASMSARFRSNLSPHMPALQQEIVFLLRRDGHDGENHGTDADGVTQFQRHRLGLSPMASVIDRLLSQALPIARQISCHEYRERAKNCNISAWINHKD